MNISIKIKDNRRVYKTTSNAGQEMENKVTLLQFEFPEEVSSYNKYIEFKTPNGTSYDLIQNNQYIVERNITQYGSVEAQIVCKETDGTDTIVFKSQMFTLNFGKSINADEQIIPQEQIDIVNTLVDTLNVEIAKVENLNIEAEKVGTTTTITITDKQGITSTTEIYDGVDGKDGKDGVDGKDGADGKDGKDGEDYVITQEDYQEIANVVEQQITIPTQLSELTDDSTHRLVTDTEKTTWNNKSDFSGSYNDLTDKPTIPTKTSDLTNDNGFIDNSVNNLTNYTLKTNTGSTIELSINSSTYVMTLNLKNSDGTVISTGTVDLPLESVVVNGSYDSTNKKIILTLQSGSTIEFSVADLVSGLQSEITSSNKLASDLVDDTNNTNKFVTASEKATWNNKSDFSGDYNDLTNKPTIPTVPTNISAFTNDMDYATETYVDNSIVPQVYYWDGKTTQTGIDFWNNIQKVAENNEVLVYYNYKIGNIVALSYIFFIKNASDMNYTIRGFNNIPYSNNREMNSYHQFIYRECVVTFTRDNEGNITNITSNITNFLENGTYLDANYNYSTPYTPLYNGSPATKKYVDDIVGNIETLLSGI